MGISITRRVVSAAIAVPGIAALALTGAPAAQADVNGISGHPVPTPLPVIRSVEHFTITDYNGRDDEANVQARGRLLRARGVDVQETGNRDLFIFRRGSLKVTHHALRDRIIHRDGVTRLYEEGTYRINGGTRALRGASGWGRYRLVASWRGTDVAPRHFREVIQAEGPLQLPSVTLR